MTDTLVRNQRRLRVAIGLSQADLAAAASVTKSTIAMIEQGKANPRLGTLLAIAEALRVDVAELLAPPAPPPVEVVRASPEDSRDLAGGGELLLLPPNHEEEVEDEPDGWHFVYVLEGRLITGPIEAPTELDAGDSAAFDATSPMLLRTGGDPARALVLTV